VKEIIEEDNQFVFKLTKKATEICRPICKCHSAMR
jgi:hypothetical protein